MTHAAPVGLPEAVVPKAQFNMRIVVPAHGERALQAFIAATWTAVVAVVRRVLGQSDGSHYWQGGHLDQLRGYK